MYTPKAALLTMLLVCGEFPPTLAQNPQPPAPVREATDDYFGTKVSDPYRWMEDSKNPETIAWMKAQADFTRDYLDHLPMRRELLERINNLSDAEVEVQA